MLTFSTKHEERLPGLFVIRIQGHRLDAVIYSRDAACYVKKDGQWCFGAIGSDQEVTISPIMTDKRTARRMAERTAELMWKADLASAKVA